MCHFICKISKNSVHTHTALEVYNMKTVAIYENFSVKRAEGSERNTKVILVQYVTIVHDCVCVVRAYSMSEPPVSVSVWSSETM